MQELFTLGWVTGVRAVLIAIACCFAFVSMATIFEGERAFDPTFALCQLGFEAAYYLWLSHLFSQAQTYKFSAGGLRTGDSLDTARRALVEQGALAGGGVRIVSTRPALLSPVKLAGLRKRARFEAPMFNPNGATSDQRAGRCDEA